MADQMETIKHSLTSSSGARNMTQALLEVYFLACSVKVLAQSQCGP